MVSSDAADEPAEESAELLARISAIEAEIAQQQRESWATLHGHVEPVRTSAPPAEADPVPDDWHVEPPRPTGYWRLRASDEERTGASGSARNRSGGATPASRRSGTATGRRTES